MGAIKIAANNNMEESDIKVNYKGTPEYKLHQIILSFNEKITQSYEEVSKQMLFSATLASGSSTTYPMEVPEFIKTCKLSYLSLVKELNELYSSIVNTNSSYDSGNTSSSSNFR